MAYLQDLLVINTPSISLRSSQFQKVLLLLQFEVSYNFTVYWHSKSISIIFTIYRYIILYHHYFCLYQMLRLYYGKFFFLLCMTAKQNAQFLTTQNNDVIKHGNSERCMYTCDSSMWLWHVSDIVFHRDYKQNKHQLVFLSFIKLPK